MIMIANLTYLPWQSRDVLDQDTSVAPTADINYCVKMKKLIPSVSHVLVVCWGDVVGCVVWGKVEYM